MLPTSEEPDALIGCFSKYFYICALIDVCYAKMLGSWYVVCESHGQIVYTCFLWVPKCTEDHESHVAQGQEDRDMELAPSASYEKRYMHAFIYTVRMLVKAPKVA